MFIVFLPCDCFVQYKIIISIASSQHGKPFLLIGNFILPICSTTTQQPELLSIPQYKAFARGNLQKDKPPDALSVQTFIKGGAYLHKDII